MDTHTQAEIISTFAAYLYSKHVCLTCSRLGCTWQIAAWTQALVQ